MNVGYMEKLGDGFLSGEHRALVKQKLQTSSLLGRNFDTYLYKFPYCATSKGRRMNDEILLEELVDARQIETLVNMVLNDINEMDRDEYLTKVFIRCMEEQLFTGAKRAISHLSSAGEKKSAAIYYMIGSYHSNNNKHKRDPSNYLDHIKMLPSEEQNSPLATYLNHFIRKYQFSETLALLMKEAFDLLNPSTREFTLGVFKNDLKKCDDNLRNYILYIVSEKKERKALLTS